MVTRASWAQRLLILVLMFCCVRPLAAADGRFDLLGPKIDVRVTRGADTLPIASVPNLQAGDKLWIHPDLPPTQSVKYLLICVFLRGNTNPPPDSWFFRIETWKKEVRDEGAFITVPDEAQQAVLFLAPETGGDFSTLKSAVRGRPGVFVRASQDLAEAGFEQARVERYLADIRRVPSSDTEDLQKHSNLLSATLALRPNVDCFKRPIEQQFNCLTQSGSQMLLDDGHGQSIVTSLSNGSNSDFINQASYTQLAGAGAYSAYVGAIVDLIRIMGNLHTAQYQYIPAIAFPQGDALNLRLNTPPSFHNPKSVLVIGLPSIQTASKPPLRPVNPNAVACLLQPSVVLPVDGAPLVFSTDFATHLVLHLNTPSGAPSEPDIPLVADAYQGGLVLQQVPEHHVPLHTDRQTLGTPTPETPGSRPTVAGKIAELPTPAPRPEPILLTGTVEGRWGFDSFTGPTLPLQQLPGGNWHVISPDGSATDVIAGKTTQLYLGSTGSACVHTVTVAPSGTNQEHVDLHFKMEPKADQPALLAVALPSNREMSPGNLHLEIQQYGQPKPDALATRTFADPAHIGDVQLPAGDRSLLLTGTNLQNIQKLTLGDLVFKPEPPPSESDGDDLAAPAGSLKLSLLPSAAVPPTHAGDRLTAQVTLNDGRVLPVPLTILPARPAITLLSHTSDPIPGSLINLSSPEDLPVASHLDFTLKSKTDFPRTTRVQVETLDGALRAVLTLAPAGGLVLQDPKTIVAGLDPLRAFGPSAFGALRFRVIFPAKRSKARHADPDESAGDHAQPPATAETTTAVASPPPSPEDAVTTSDWLPLGTLVRLPTLAHLQCTTDPATPCNLAGTNLFLLQAVSAEPDFSHPDPVPDGFTGAILPVPHPAGSAATLFFKLRDDPSAIASATIPTSTTTTQASATHTHSGAAHN